MRRASVVARWRCVEVKGRKPWLRRSEPPLRVCLGPLALSQGSTVSSHRHKALQGAPQPLHGGPGPTASGVGTMAVPSSCRPRQSLTTALVTQNPASPPMSLPRKTSLSVDLPKRAASCVSLPAPPPLKNHTTLPPAPGPPVSFDRTCLPQQGLLRSLKRPAAAE